MTDRAGYLNEPDLVVEIIDATLELFVPLHVYTVPDTVATTILAAFQIMSKRGLLSDLGIEQVHKAIELYSQRQ